MFDIAQHFYSNPNTPIIIEISIYFFDSFFFDFLLKKL